MIQVITSWQVIAVTIALLLYLNIVFYYSKSYHTPKFKKISFKRKKKQPVAEAGGPEEAASGSNSNEELGLEEE